jgi:hypothetical protein
MPRGYSQNNGEIFPYKGKEKKKEKCKALHKSTLRLISRMRMRRLR